jgi:hypothetical protein
MDKQADKQASSSEKSGEVKIEAFWRDATAEDVAKVMKGETAWQAFQAGFKFAKGEQ